MDFSKIIGVKKREKGQKCEGVGPLRIELEDPFRYKP